ncbi:MAG: hypothetical protein V8T86_15890 [Victivallis sp.]
MKITGKKLAEALSALGKLITRTSSVELHQAVLLEARDGQLRLRTVAQDEPYRHDPGGRRCRLQACRPLRQAPGTHPESCRNSYVHGTE